MSAGSACCRPAGGEARLLCAPAGGVDEVRAAHEADAELVIHGEKDHRVPISEALRLWTDMARHGVEGKFLYFPDENHWILKPQNARIWYETVLAFLRPARARQGVAAPAARLRVH